jgi:hypothetical protein
MVSILIRLELKVFLNVKRLSIDIIFNFRKKMHMINYSHCYFALERHMFINR